MQLVLIVFTLPTVTILMVLSIVYAKTDTGEMEQTVKVRLKSSNKFFNECSRHSNIVHKFFGQWLKPLCKPSLCISGESQYDSNCHVARAYTNCSWSIRGHVSLDKCNFRVRGTSEELLPNQKNEMAPKV